MAELKILHVVPRWNHGGGAQSILAEARHAREHALAVTHQALSLEPGGSLQLLTQAVRARVRVQAAPDPERERAVVESADLLVVHYWNAPSLRAFVDRWRGRALRWILYSRVNGLHSPQRLPMELVRSACHTVLTSPHGATGGRLGEVSVIPAIVPRPDPAAAADAKRNGLLHVGTLNVFKLAADFINLHVGLESSDGPVTVAGAGGDEDIFQERAERLGIAGHFSWAGFVPEPGILYRRARLLTYPVAPFTYASSDKVVQEAQMHGLPVLLSRAAPLAHLVEEGVTGMLAGDGGEYTALLRGILANARHLPGTAEITAAAIRMHDPDAKIRRLLDIYRQVVAGPKRAVEDGFPDLAGWLEFQGAGMARRQRPSLETMTASPEALYAYQCWACEGGLAQYQNAYPALRQVGAGRRTPPP